MIFWWLKYLVPEVLEFLKLFRKFFGTSNVPEKSLFLRLLLELFFNSDFLANFDPWGLWKPGKSQEIPTHPPLSPPSATQEKPLGNNYINLNEHYAQQKSVFFVFVI